MESIIELRKKTGVLVAAHRGTSGGKYSAKLDCGF